MHIIIKSGLCSKRSHSPLPALLPHLDGLNCVSDLCRLKLTPLVYIKVLTCVFVCPMLYYDRPPDGVNFMENNCEESHAEKWVGGQLRGAIAESGGKRAFEVLEMWDLLFLF